MTTRDKRKAAVAWLSVLSNAALVALKVLVGLLIGSVSVISEAIHSGVDLAASVIALVAVKSSAKPADEQHPFGHGKFENISGVVEAMLIFLAAGWIIYDAAHKLITQPQIDAPAWGVGVMALSGVVNWAVSWRLFKVSKETDSVALGADAWHHRTDVYTSFGVMAGLGLIWAGDLVLKPWGFTESQLDVLHWIDPIAAIVVACLIVKAAWELTLSSVRDLMDVSLPAGEQAWIRQMITEFLPVLHGYHRMRARKAGHERFIDFHIFVDSTMTVDDSHRLAHEISRRIEEHFEGSSVTVHVEPCRGNCDHCREGCLLSSEQQQAIRDAKAAEGPEAKSTWQRDGSKG